MRKILIPTDFSKNAKDALNYALKFIENSMVELHLLNVITPITTSIVDGSNIGTTIIEAHEKQANESMENLKKEAESFLKKNDYNHVKILTHISIGEVILTIPTMAKELEIDLIIMGTQGKNHSFLEKIMGTISTYMTQHSPCPVLLVPQNYNYKKIDNLIFATDLNTGDPYELSRAIKLITPHNPVVRCVYVRKEFEDKFDKTIEGFAKYFVDHSPSIRTTFNIEIGEHPAEIVGEQAEIYDAELIVMHKSRKNFLQRLFKKNHTKAFINKLNLPILILN